ncbi:MAG TPA: hypothetical protein VK928_02525, partial [Longimicrobiales bacterium]|nr:hypothetical protein [Longimicrobiales bacterium]
ASWWSAEESAYGEGLFRPMTVTTRVDTVAGGSILRLAITDERWLSRTWTPIIPDHGKMMHMFLVRVPDMDVFAHLHPTYAGADTFRLSLPRLPEGRYALYGDIVHESGFAQTLTDTVTIPVAPASAQAADADDSWWSRDLATGTSSSMITFDDGVTLTWQRPDRIVEGVELELRFDARTADGSAAALEYYMGMPAHGAVRRDDGSVFVHLHPTGTISMAAQQRQAAFTMSDHAAHAEPAIAAPPVVAIPYAFPQAGRYRLWVQVRVDGVVRTGAWDLDVEAR